MKKFFTLIALTLLSSGAFAQGKWNYLVVNGDMEGEQDPMWSSFWCHDYRQGLEFNAESGQQYSESGQFQGFAEIIEDPVIAGNHCARVIARSEAEADEAGNKTEANGGLASWDCQFFIYGTDTIPEGMELVMTLKVRADKDGQFETQAHWTPGDYNYWQCFGNVSVTTEWKEVEVSTKVTSNMAHGEGGGKRMQSVAFNLSTNTEGNVFYFDDVELKWRTPKAPEDFKTWFNMLRHGTESMDKIGNYTNFTGRDAKDGTDRPCRVVADPVDGQPALTVASVGWEGEKQDVDDDGNPKFDDEGNPVMVQYFVKDDGTEKTAIDDWEAQFFVTVPHKFVPGSKYRLVMWYRSDVDGSVDTQLHTMPGNYIHYEAIGTLSTTPEWQKLEIEEPMRDQGDGCQTIAFNCNKDKNQPNNFYFRFEEFSFNSAEVSDDEATLATEDVMLPVPEPAKTEGAVGTIDFTNCLSTLETEAFEVLVENMTVRSGEESFDKVDATAGFYIADNGWLSQDETPIAFEVGDVSDDNPMMEITTYNTGDSFVGKSIPVKFRYSYGDSNLKWFYLFNVTLVPEETYTGISEVKTPAQNNVMYDLMGRRIQKAVKGMYIMNGKKYFAK